MLRSIFGEDVFATDARSPPVSFDISQPLRDSPAMSFISRRNRSRSAGGSIVSAPMADLPRGLRSLAR
ncbi:hypothetical protein [Burkholderia sp. S-53]|uniref:hypothetical protein n=1 Tax=Burkholderia sp. S-53 TaxID=2906514 RepID=UPI0021D03D4B|nr:hypothetical protein [Burkholderia sp. S-53]UXU85649.1 hypothetical protein LXM88_04600 [Burkholderia sp. S-53]